MRGAMFKAAALLVFGLLFLPGVLGGNTCLAADGAPGDAPPAEAAPPVLPMPESTPDGWTDAQLAALKRMEIRVKHQGTRPSIFGKKMDALFKVAAFDPLPISDVSPLCIRQARLQTNFGEIRAGTFARDKQKGDFFNNCLTSYYGFGQIDTPPILEEISIHNAVADIEPYYGAPADAMLRNVDVRHLLRTVPLPAVEIVRDKDEIPMADRETILIEDEKLRKPYTKNSQNIMIHLSDVFTEFGDSEKIYYTIEVWPIPIDSRGFSKIIFLTNIGRYQTSGADAGYSVTHGIKGGTKRIVIKQVKVRDKSATLRDALPMLVKNPFKTLPIVTDNGPVPPSPYGIYGP